MRKAIFVAVLLAMTAAAVAATRGTPAEAKAMLAKAVAHYKTVGRTRALADFSAGKAGFHDRDLYVVCIGASSHLVTAHGFLPQHVGTPANILKDSNGKPLGQAILDAAAAKGEGSIHYTWINPMTGKLEPKTSFVQRVGDDVCLVGAYSP